MKYLIFILIISSNIEGQNFNSESKAKKSYIETGSFISFNSYKTVQNPGVYIGYWYKFPIDETNTYLELGGDFNYSKSKYDFIYGKHDQFYNIQSEEFFVDMGARMVKNLNLGKYEIAWLSELSFHNLFFDGKDVPDEIKTDENGNTINVNIDVVIVSSLKFGQGIQFWKNNFGIGISASYFPYNLWYKKTVPKNFYSISVETGFLYRF